MRRRLYMNTLLRRADSLCCYVDGQYLLENNTPYITAMYPWHKLTEKNLYLCFNQACLSINVSSLSVSSSFNEMVVLRPEKELGPPPAPTKSTDPAGYRALELQLEVKFSIHLASHQLAFMVSIVVCQV